MTPRFGAAEPGTAAARWRPWRAQLPDIGSLSNIDRVLVVAAHPDDETLGAGGLLARAHRVGADVTVVIATNGEASHPHSPTHRPDELAAIRRGEVYAAVGVLAPDAEIVFLDLPDGRLAERQAELTERVAPLCAGRTVIVTPWADDAHPDHEACARAVVEVLASRRGDDASWLGDDATRLWQYPVWAWQWSHPGADVMAQPAFARLVIDPDEQQAKTEAISCFGSQTAPLSARRGDEAVLTPALLEHFRGPDEVFADVTPPHVEQPAYFAAMYREHADPWGLAQRWYEQRKRAVLLAGLPRPRFRRAFEPGCATGLLTAELARRCAEVLAWDVVDRAVEQARTRTANSPGVRVELGHIPVQWPSGEFDLVVLSEVAYYVRDLTRLAALVEGSLAADGVLVACHWRHPASAHLHDTRTVHDALGRGTGLSVLLEHVEPDFLLHVWSRGETSVARADGVIA